MPNNRPNILVITTHDSGRHLGCYGASVSTPAIDALAADGVKCTRMFSVAPICSPSRCSLLTGQYPQRNGMMGLAGGPWAWELNDYFKHLSHVTRSAGYSTHLFGHQHDTDFIERLGFDRLHAYLSPHDRNPEKNAPAIARTFAEFCKHRPADKPFYAQMGFFETHTPHDFGGAIAEDSAGVRVPSFTGLNDDESRRKVAALNGSMRRVDEAVAIIMLALRENDLDSNTLVLFNTDHGPELPRGKWTLFDGGIGINFILRWPAGGVSGGRSCDLLLSNCDFLPTLAELIDLPVQHSMDGISFAGALRSETSPQQKRDAVYAMQVDSDYGVRTDRYKLMRRFRGERVEPRVTHPDGKPMLIPPVRLYDLANDPNELNDVAGDSTYAEVLADMDERLWHWLETMDDPILRGPVPTPFYLRAIQGYHDWREAKS
jgi:N-sulfoglucosamine sulfohydrolase